LYQRKNIVERLKISQGICEQFISIFNDLPNPTACLKRFQEDLDIKSQEESHAKQQHQGL
jgi:hypothetical protein